MTGLYIRIERDGKWQNLEIEDLTDDELDKFCAEKGKNAAPGFENGWPWVNALARWIRDNVVSERIPDGGRARIINPGVRTGELCTITGFKQDEPYHPHYYTVAVDGLPEKDGMWFWPKDLEALPREGE